MSGIQEILVIIGIILAIVFIPRATSRNQWKRSSAPPPGNPITRLPGRVRLAIIASLIWLFGAAVYFEPWNNNLQPFLIIGSGPVLLGWGVGWVVSGFRKKRN
ncbi:MAG: hypothetical protein GY859_17280 [Desulfobacterales bacterium]|nr:hypothetical protein [Desulfobacterales bacterium]